MKRSIAFDPPEYVDWEPDADELRAWRERLERVPERRAVIESLDTGRLVDLYRGLLRFRLHDIALQRWVKQGVISKAWLGTGEEAVTIGAVHALRRGPGGDIVGPMIRNAGACHEMGVPVADMLRTYLGTGDAPTKGRDLHLGDPARGVVAPASMVGSLATVVNGYALAFRARNEDRVALTWIGDGATKSGEVHEALNFAAVRRLPAIFVLQNNQVALGTAVERHHRPRGFGDWGRAYGVRLFEADGNNVLDVLAATSLAAEMCRAGGGPAFVAAETFRMGGHATHDVREARESLDAELFARWGRRDPIGLFEAYLTDLPLDLASDSPDGTVASRSERNRAVLEAVEAEVREEVEAAAAQALASRDASVPAPDSAGEEACYG